MSGAGKWVKKHPVETAIILGVATGGVGMAMAPAAAAGAAGAGAAAGGAAPLGLGTASLFGAEAGLGASMLGEAGAGMSAGLLGGVPAAAGGAAPMGLGTSALFGAEAGSLGGSMLPAAGAGGFNMGAFLDKMGPYAKMAGQAQGLLNQEPQQMPPMQTRPQTMAQAPSGGLLPYGDMQEEEKWRRMAATGRFYG